MNNQDNFFTEFLTEITHEATWLWTFLVGQFLITDSTSFNAYRKCQAFQLYLYRWPWTTRGVGRVRGLSPLRVRNPRTTLQLALCVPGSASMNSTKRRSRSETATENKSACKGTHALQSCGVQGPTLFFPEVRSPCLTSKMNYWKVVPHLLLPRFCTCRSRSTACLVVASGLSVFRHHLVGFISVFSGNQHLASLTLW